MKVTNGDGRKHWDIYLIILLVFLILFAGLRASYNDTGNYIVGFNASVGIREFLSNPDNLQPLENPLFYGFQALIRTFTDNVNVFFMYSGAVIVNFLNIRFIKRNTEINDFAFSMFLLCGFRHVDVIHCGTKTNSVAMSILTLALNQFVDRKSISVITSLC